VLSAKLQMTIESRREARPCNDFVLMRIAMSIELVPIQKDIQSQRHIEAEAWRQSLAESGILCVNMISSPGAGKTTLLQAMAKHWAGRQRMAVLVGDIATDRDAQRLAPWVPVKQLTTGGACHLELPLVQAGWQQLNLHGIEFLIIENVGNLVCPASHDLGEHLRVVLLSVTEGDDKPGKYPKSFRTSQACVINKIDLLPYVPFSISAVSSDAHRVQSNLPIFPLSSLNGEGISTWCEFLISQRQKLLSATDFVE
jgi:hydrogenase nickel incorporation protein HypB